MRQAESENRDKVTRKEEYRLPCRFRYQGICTLPTSIWSGNRVTGTKTWRCNSCAKYE